MIAKEVFKFPPELFNFKTGDLVLKAEGMHSGQTGIVLSVITNSSGYTILNVYANRMVVKWYSNMVSFL
tara:strand:- start:1139 stop:1345 length:207 start_codon:yes stop_codon:yes gene_type:complete